MFNKRGTDQTESLELDPEICTSGVKALFNSREKGQYFVAEENDEIIGSLMITYEWSDWRCGTVWWIQSVFVKPAVRGKGVYKGLYNFIKQQVESDKNIRGIRLYVDSSNLKAKVVYTKLDMNGQHYQVFEWMK